MQGDRGLQNRHPLHYTIAILHTLCRATAFTAYARHILYGLEGGPCLVGHQVDLYRRKEKTFRTIRWSADIRNCAERLQATHQLAAGSAAHLTTRSSPLGIKG